MRRAPRLSECAQSSSVGLSHGAVDAGFRAALVGSSTDVATSASLCKQVVAPSSGLAPGPAASSPACCIRAQATMRTRASRNLSSLSPGASTQVFTEREVALVVTTWCHQCLGTKSTSPGNSVVSSTRAVSAPFPSPELPADGPPCAKTELSSYGTRVGDRQGSRGG
eukprot:scaffold13057_cov111-Isochrysis_galbana.AAC.2